MFVTSRVGFRNSAPSQPDIEHTTQHQGVLPSHGSVAIARSTLDDRSSFQEYEVSRTMFHLFSLYFRRKADCPVRLFHLCFGLFFDNHDQTCAKEEAEVHPG